MPLIEQVEAQLRASPRRWLVTGAAGFIGSHLVERLLTLGQTVVGLDDFSTGHLRNLDDAVARAGVGASSRWRLIKGDCAEPGACAEACASVDAVLHQAAIGSVPRSIEDPLRTHRANVDGFIQVLNAARTAKVSRFVYASSSSVYGDEPTLPKREDRIGRVLSPYAATKRIDELYASTFSRVYGVPTVGLRYFNVFGPRQDPEGAYAAVIPRWIERLRSGTACDVYGDGQTTRDFCYVANVVQVNVLAACSDVTEAVFNVAVGGRTTLNALHDMIRSHIPQAKGLEPKYLPFRAGDIRDSQADLTQITAQLGYSPTHTIAQGMTETVLRTLEAAR